MGKNEPLKLSKARVLYSFLYNPSQNSLNKTEWIGYIFCQLDKYERTWDGIDIIIIIAISWDKGVRL